MRTFYVDESKTFGVNNEVFPNVGMPHVLEDLQGVPRKTYEQRMVDGSMTDVYVGLRAEGGKLSADEYDQAILDLVNFLVYTGEPARLKAESIGRWALIFCVVLFVFVYLTKKEYWRDVH